MPCAPAPTRAEVIAHPHVAANGTLVESHHSVAGRLRQARSPARFSAMPLDPSRPGRPLGADTVAVLAEAGYDRDSIAALLD